MKFITLVLFNKGIMGPGPFNNILPVRVRQLMLSVNHGRREIIVNVLI